MVLSDAGTIGRGLGKAVDVKLGGAGRDGADRKQGGDAGGVAGYGDHDSVTQAGGSDRLNDDDVAAP
jgi:hypothetical protein